MVLGGTITPIDGLKIQGLYRFYDRNFADWSPGSREIGDDGVADRVQVWEAPDYSRIDLHAYYDLPGSFSAGSTDITIQAFFHVFNVLDAIYVQDAFDDSRYNGYHDDGRHDASSAEVFLGTPRYFNAGLTFRF